MSGKILLVDPATTRRILLKVRLQGAGFEVISCSTDDDARLALAQEPDLILLDPSSTEPELREFCSAVKLGQDTSTTPVLALGACDRRNRTDWLSAGADDALDREVCDAHLFARIRSLLRLAIPEAKVTPAAEQALGFAETAERFTRAARVLILTPIPIRARTLVQSLETGGRFLVSCFDPNQPLPPTFQSPDVILIDARPTPNTATRGHALRLITELRSRTDTRSAEQIVITPEDGSAIAALALDLGASDTVTSDASHDEITIRISKLHLRKVKRERLRDTLRSGVEAALIDPLTGLHNRRYAEPHIRAIEDHSREHGTRYAVLAIDIDHFKKINDTYGHAAGDQALTAIAALLKECTRKHDLIARFGGEEFIVVMPETTHDEAKVAAERLRFRIETTPIYAELAGVPIAVTVSVGIALGGTPNEPFPVLMQRADAALYRSKLAGRNTVSISAPC